MTESENHELIVTQQINASPDRVWEVMTTRLEDWFCPKPWRAEVVEMDLRAGGRFATTMHGPEGECFSSEGIFLEVTPGQRWVSTDAVDSRWQPQNPFMIGLFEIEAKDGGTRFTGRARHWSDESRKQHEEMGFSEGWAAMARQLAELAEG